MPRWTSCPTLLPDRPDRQHQFRVVRRSRFDTHHGERRWGNHAYRFEDMGWWGVGNFAGFERRGFADVSSEDCRRKRITDD